MKIFSYQFILSTILLLIALNSKAQKDSVVIMSSSVFERIGKEMQNFKADTSAPPQDKITKKIIQLRALRGGFNINEAIDFKIADDRQKKDISENEAAALTAYFKQGNGKRWLDNATTWIYRSHFTYRELKQMIRFYKSAAGKKMADDFPIVMLQTLAAGEMIKKKFDQDTKKPL